jgi:hypothetical protein
MIVDAANSGLKPDHSDFTAPPPTVSDKWLKRWLARYPTVWKRRGRAIELDRKRSEDREAIHGWFGALGKVMKDNGIGPDDIRNFDETGFRIGVSRDQWIITRDPDPTKPHIGLNSNREYATVIEAVNAEGWSVPPTIILGGKTILEGWFENTTIEGGYYIGVSDTAYTTDLLAFTWIQNFWRDTYKNRKGNKSLLICDGYGSHITFEFTNFCEKHGIILFILPPHTSHFLQPLDVGVFHAYKHWHSRTVAEATYSGCSSYKI